MYDTSVVLSYEADGLLMAGYDDGGKTRTIAGVPLGAVARRDGSVVVMIGRERECVFITVSPD
ncbi:MAG: hypothetical protein ABSC73_03400 [Acidimicrobiales bacterium]|jgi:hypothetical protein